MLRIGQWTLRLALLLIVAGLLGGFGLMLFGYPEPGMSLVTLVPFGFVIGFAGLAIVVLHEKRDG